MFTAKDAALKVVEAREASEAEKKAKERAEKKQLKEAHQQAEEKVYVTLSKALREVEEAAGKPLSTIRFEVGHRQGSPCLRTKKLTELVMKQLSDLGFIVENTSSDSKEQTETVHFKAHVWRYTITISW